MLITRAVPKSGQSLPVIGLGTWQVLERDDAAEGEDSAEVLRRLAEVPGSVVDTSPMYGRAEAVLGQLLAATGLREHLFLATKVWTDGERAGIDQMQRSFELIGVDALDLIQVHNLLDWRVHLKQLRAWHDQGRVRHVGVTHYHSGAYDQLEAVLKQEPLDFVQFNYSLVEREAEARLLPLAAERGVAVIINRPFVQCRMFAKVKGQALPDWAAEFDCQSWAQFFLKFVVGHEAVTCAIPATAKPRHMTDNLGAGRGRLPDLKMRARMASWFEAM
jgi:diketogulonate reductase-like aldo/keto reductase